MKKYLMTGVAALAIFAAFTSCSKSEELYDPGQIEQNEIAQVYESYNQAFLLTFGQPAASQDWGFKSILGTRAGGEFADHVGAYTDGNMWTSKGFLPPDPLTDGQKLRVQYYFQMTKITNPNQPDNLSQDFFMQEVYDGGDDPMTRYKQGDYSPEVYKDAGGNTITSGDHMDHLTAGPGHLHINNFNNSTCGWYENVSNWDQTNVNDRTQQHRDQIELMLNTPTSCFGYANSNNTEIYDDQWTLVAGSVIDNFCDNVDPEGWAAFLAAHPGVVDKAVVDKWNRSFMGFDFKLMPNPDPISKINGVTETAKYSDADGSQWGFAYNGTNVVTYNDNTAEILINGQPIPVVIDNLNFFAAENIVGVGGQDNHNDFDAYKDFVPGGANDDCLYLKNHTQNVQGDHVALNLKFIERMVNDGFLPVHGKHLKLWVKVSDLTDGYYTDWIVSFMPASYNPPTPPSDKVIRIMAEDLNAKANKSEDVIEDDSDWDFNDVVLDVKFLGNDLVEITVVAAGGTLPLRINGEDALEVHGLFGQPTNIMINTCRTDESKRKYPNHYNKAELPVFTRTIAGVDADGGRSIKLEVQKTLSNGSTQWFEMTARQGNPAAKFAVKPTVDFCEERQHITSKYPLFGQWVENAGDLVWWNPLN